MDAVEVRVAKGLIESVRGKIVWLARSASHDDRMRLHAEILGDLAGLEMVIDNIGADA